MSCDLLWNTHIEYVVKKANKRLYILRLLLKTGVGTSELVTVCVSIIKPIIEFAAPVWSAIPDYLSIKLEKVQKRAVRITNPGALYQDSLNRAGLEKLSKRKDNICKEFAKDNKLSGPIKHLFKHKSNSVSHKYNLRHSTEPNCAGRITTDKFLSFLTSKY